MPADTEAISLCGTPYVNGGKTATAQAKEGCALLPRLVRVRMAARRDAGNAPTRFLLSHFFPNPPYSA